MPNNTIANVLAAIGILMLALATFTDAGKSATFNTITGVVVLLVLVCFLNGVGRTKKAH